MEHIKIADFDLPDGVSQDYDNVYIDYIKETGILRLSFFYEDHWCGEVCLDLINNTIYDDFTKGKE